MDPFSILKFNTGLSSAFGLWVINGLWIFNPFFLIKFPEILYDPGAGTSFLRI